MIVNLLDIENFIKPLQQRINTRLLDYLPAISTTPARLHEAMHYAVFNGGKRVRPLLIYATGLCLQIDLNKLDIPAAAMELIHCYSLVHDDLPAMDNDDYRRGKLSCHKAFDEPTAILVGDALQSLAFNLLAQKNNLLNSEQQVAMIATLTQATGSLGIAGGQQLDLDNKNKKLTDAEIENIHQLKTGALFEACTHLAIAASTFKNENLSQSLNYFAKIIGLAFQLQDDYVDETPSLTLKKKIDNLFTQAKTILDSLPINSSSLHLFCQYLLSL